MNVTMDLTDQVLEFSRTYFAVLDPDGKGNDRRVTSVRVGESVAPSCSRLRKLRRDLTAPSLSTARAERFAR